jgi:hypothetical protein
MGEQQTTNGNVSEVNERGGRLRDIHFFKGLRSLRSPHRLDVL